MSHTVTITHPQDAPVAWILGDQVRFMGAVAGSDLHVVEVTIPPGSGTPPHRHDSVEIFRVTEGEVTFGIFEDGPPRMVVAGPGTVVTLPSRVGHNYQNTGDTPAAMTAVLERQMLDFFTEVASTDAPAPGAPSPEVIGRIMAACARHGIEMVAAA